MDFVKFLLLVTLTFNMVKKYDLIKVNQIQYGGPVPKDGNCIIQMLAVASSQMVEEQIFGLFKQISGYHQAK